MTTFPLPLTELLGQYGSYFIYLLIGVLFGATLGSFLNVVIHRLPQDLSIIKPRSKCPACDQAIRWYDNIPILSFFILGRKCRDCGQPISWRYPLVEALTVDVGGQRFPAIRYRVREGVGDGAVVVEASGDVGGIWRETPVLPVSTEQVLEPAVTGQAERSEAGAQLCARHRLPAARPVEAVARPQHALSYSRGHDSGGLKGVVDRSLHVWLFES